MDEYLLIKSDPHEWKTTISKIHKLSHCLKLSLAPYGWISKRGVKKTKHAKFSEKRALLTPWYAQSPRVLFFKLNFSILQTYFRGGQQISPLTLGEFKPTNHSFSPKIVRKRYLYNIKLFVTSTWLTREITHFDSLKNLMNKYYLGWYCPSSVTSR